MKTLATRIVRHAAALPLVGRAVRIAIAIARLPELRADIAALNAGSYPAGAAAAQPALWQALAELRESQMGDANLTRSVPVALRRLTREVHALRARLDAAGIGHEQDAAAPPSAISAGPYPAPATGPFKLYLGSGEAAPAGYLNVATHAGAGVDIVARFEAMPVAPGQADEILVAWLFETCAQRELGERVLPHLFCCLKPGGRLRAQVADAGAAIAAYTAGGAYDDLRETLFGAAGQDQQLRMNMYTPASLAGLLRAAGFGEPQVSAAGRRAGRPHTFDIAADKPLPSSAS